MTTFLSRFTAYVKEPRHPGLPPTFVNDLVEESSISDIENKTRKHAGMIANQGGMLYTPETPYVPEFNSINGQIYVPLSSISHVTISISPVVSAPEIELVQ